MKGFTPLDTAAVLLYLVAVAALGSSFYRRNVTAREYFLGNKSMSWIPVGISIIAADMSALSIMGSPAWAYKHNLELSWSSFAYPMVAPIVILVFVPFYAKLNLYTAYEYLERRFSLHVRLVASVLFLLLRGLHVALVIYAPSLVLNFVTGYPVWQCILFMGSITTAYTALGGMKAVIWTDVIQFTTVMVGILLVFATVVTNVDISVTEAIREASAAGRLSFLNFSTNPAELTSFWACVIGGAVLCLAPLTTDQAILQRLFTTKSEADCRQAIILQSVIIVPITLLLNAVGVALYVFYSHHPERLAGLANTDSILPFFAVREMPSGVSGFIVASIFAASMSVMSAGINALTTASTVDFYQRLWRPGLSSEHYGSVGRVGTVLWGATVTITALFANRLGELALAYNFASSVISGPLLGIFLLATLSARASSAGVLAGAAAGGITVVCVNSLTDWSFFYLGPIGLLATIFFGYGASLFTNPPEPVQILGYVRGRNHSRA